MFFLKQISPLFRRLILATFLDAPRLYPPPPPFDLSVPPPNRLVITEARCKIRRRFLCNTVARFVRYVYNMIFNRVRGVLKKKWVVWYRLEKRIHTKNIKMLVTVSIVFIL